MKKFTKIILDKNIKIFIIYIIFFSLNFQKKYIFSQKYLNCFIIY